MQPEEEAALAAATPHGGVALAFVQALAAGNGDVAHRMLTPEARVENSPASLVSDFAELASYVDGETAADSIEVTAANSMDGWAGQEPGDLGWVYVSVCGPYPDGCGVWVEAVSVVVTTRLLIREIIWGRP